MPATSRLLLFVLFVFFQTNYFSFSQQTTLSIRELVQRLEAKNDVDDTVFAKVLQEMAGRDSTFVISTLGEMEKVKSSSHYYDARFFMLKAFQTFRFYFRDQPFLVKKYCDQALAEAYRTGDEYLISSICQRYGELMYASQEIELSATYYLKSEEINQQLGKKVESCAGMWLQLGEVLFHTREYEKSIYYLGNGLQNWHDTSGKSDYYRIRFWNALGQDYQQMGQLDSALMNYKKSMQIAEKVKDSVWMGINSGFMGQVYFLRKEYGRAKALLEYDYNINKVHEWNIAAYTLHWLARISLVQGRKDSALLQIKAALGFLRKSASFPLQRVNFLEHVYYTTADVYRAIGNTDSFYHYFILYSSLHDSLERVAALSSIKIAQLRINNEKNYQTIQSLEHEKEAEKLKRNFILAAIAMCSIIAILIINGRRLRSAHKHQLALQQKQALEAEAKAAKEQLKMFRKNVIEKTNLIERLQQQIHHDRVTAEQSQVIAALSHQTILTDEDWDKFKSLFEKIYPGFFLKLRQRASDITIAEQRMAALTRLHLTTKQMASMLGISADSVHKTRQRLRERFQISDSATLEELILDI